MHSVSRQKGAVILTVAFALLFLLGFMAIALDLGHMMVVKDELQTSVDACALAAAQELDGADDALTRAANAGIAAGNLNNVDFQSGTWNGQSKIVPGDITFKDASYGTTTVAANAKYAQCQHSQNGIRMWLIQAMGAFAGSNDPAYSNVKGVAALAVATRASAQSVCPIPIGLKQNGPPPNFGYLPGQWATLYHVGSSQTGEMGWYNLDGSTNANETKNELGEPGVCGITVNTTLGTPGAQSSVDVPWNERFGIYKNNDPGPSVNHPDFSGYAYTSKNWPVQKSAYDGTCPLPLCTDPTAANFKTKRQAFANYDDTGGTNAQAVNGGDSITGLNMKGGFQKLASHGAGGQHQQFGFGRRIVSVPVVNGNHPVAFACMLMLEPMSGPTADVHLEFLGNASDPKSPCTSNGLAGGAGPLTPVLVQ